MADDRSASKKEGESFARLLATSWNAFYNFGRWKHEEATNTEALYSVDLLDVADLPKILHLASEQFMLTVLEWAWGQELRVETTRFSNSHMRFEIFRAKD